MSRALHESVPHAIGFSLGAQKTAVMNHPVDGRRGHLVVAEHRSPPRELEVGGEGNRLRLVSLRDCLEEQVRSLGIEGRKAQLAYDQEARAPNLRELAVEPAAVVCSSKAHHQRRGGEEPGLDLRLAAHNAGGTGHVGLAASDVSHQNQVFFAVHERQGQEAVASRLLRPRDASPVISVEGLECWQRAAAQKRGPPGGIAALRLGFEIGEQELHLPGRAATGPFGERRLGERAALAGLDRRPGHLLASGHRASPPLRPGRTRPDWRPWLRPRRPRSFERAGRTTRRPAYALT